MPPQRPQQIGTLQLPEEKIAIPVQAAAQLLRVITGIIGGVKFPPTL